MSAGRQLSESLLLMALAAAPIDGIDEGHVETAALALYVNGALAGELEVRFEEGIARSDEVIAALFTSYGYGFVERAGCKWRLTNSGRSMLHQAGFEVSAETKSIVEETLDATADEALHEIGELLSSQYAMMAAADGEPVRI